MGRQQDLDRIAAEPATDSQRFVMTEPERHMSHTGC